MPKLPKPQIHSITSPLKKAKEIIRQVRQGFKDAEKDVREMGDELKGSDRP